MLEILFFSIVGGYVIVNGLIIYDICKKDNGTREDLQMPLQL